VSSKFIYLLQVGGIYLQYSHDDISYWLAKYSGTFKLQYSFFYCNSHMMMLSFSQIFRNLSYSIHVSVVAIDT